MARDLRFIIVPKVGHPWFDEVHAGARTQAGVLERELGIQVTIEYLPPSAADAAEQGAILERAMTSQPDGIAVDPVDAVARMPAIRNIRDHGIPLILFDSPSPEPGISSVGNDFALQGRIAAERLVELLGGHGKVAIMRGYPTAPNHATRYDAQMAVLAQHPGIRVVDGGTDNDDIEIARQQALAVLAAHPDLGGYLCCDASGPVGIAAAVREAGKIGQVRVVGMDGIKPILAAIHEGVIDASSATMPRMQGAMSILMLWQASLGVPLPRAIDTGIDVITRENVDRYLREIS